MTHSFAHWDDRIAAATDEHARRSLLGEIGLWRAQRITDMPAQRTASYALSLVYGLLGEGAPSLNEARQMLALSRIPPIPPSEDMRFVERHLTRVERTFAPRTNSGAARPPGQARLTEARARPQVQTRQGSPRDGARPPRVAADGLAVIDQDPFELAIEAVRAGRHAEARERVGSHRGARASLLRVWADLSEALTLEGEARDAALREVERELASRFSHTDDAAPARAAEDRPSTRSQGPLAAILGPVPDARDALVDAIMAFVTAHPEQLDAVAAAALRDHVAAHGPRAVAPWLIGTTGLAAASTEGTLTRQAVHELDGNWAVTAYSEPPFAWLVDVLRGALAGGWTFVSLRRGVLRKGAPGGRETWTLRLSKDGVERLIAAVSPNDVPEPAIAERLVARFAELCDRIVLLVTRPEQAPLVDAGKAAGFAVVAGAALALAALDTVGEHVRVNAAPVETAPQERPAREPRAPREPRVARDATDGPMNQVAAQFAGDPVDVATWAPIVATLDRGFKAFVAIRGALESMAPADLDARLAPMLEALHAATPESVRLAEGLSVAVRTAAALPDGAVAALLARDDATAARYGGRASLTLGAIARALSAGGWTVRRVLLGVTRREQRAQPALAPLGRRVEGLWRLIVSRGAQAGEIWWIDAPSPEALAAAPLLLLEPRERAFLVAPSFDGTIALPVSPVVWTGAEGDALTASIDGWPAASITDEDESA